MENYSNQNNNINNNNINNKNLNNNNFNNTNQNNKNNEKVDFRREKLKDLFINEAEGLQNEIINRKLIGVNNNQDNIGIYDSDTHYISYNEDYLNQFYSFDKKSYQNPYFITPQQQNNPQLFKKYFLDYTIKNYQLNPKTEMYKKVYEEVYQNSNQK